MQMQDIFREHRNVLCDLEIPVPDTDFDSEIDTEMFHALLERVCKKSVISDTETNSMLSYRRALSLLLVGTGLADESLLTAGRENEIVSLGHCLGLTTFNSKDMNSKLILRDAIELIYAILDLKINKAAPENPEIAILPERIANVWKNAADSLGFHNPYVASIQMEDGVWLRGLMWMPILSDDETVPLIIEATPYRHLDQSYAPTAELGSYFASKGYAFLGLDLRGSGASEGILLDEYTPREHQDIINVINWSVQQEWSNGSCGMIGFSWGGFNGLQVAALQPEALKAIVTVCSTDDRYNGDCHYMGGNVLANTMLSWSAQMLSISSMPMDPIIDTKDWAYHWKQRYQFAPQLIDRWMSHPTKDEKWKYGSVCENYAAVKAATLICAGLNDGYTSSAFRMMDALNCPRKAIIGPWAHGYSHQAVPGPNIAFLNESVRWFDRWLKEKENGIMDEPDLRVYLEDSYKPATLLEHMEGHWVGLPLPLSSVGKVHKLYFSQNGKLDRDAASGTAIYASKDLTVGFGSGCWCPFGMDKDFPVDQKHADQNSLVFETAPLTQKVTILGIPKVHLSVSVDTKVANVIVRLLDVAPDGTSCLLSRGLLNLEYRNGFERKEPILPDQVMNISVSMKACSIALPAGHKIRVAISTNYWPWVFPTPEFPKLTVNLSESSFVEIPILPASAPVQTVSFDHADETLSLYPINDDSGAWGEGCVNDIPALSNDGVYRIKDRFDSGITYFPQSDLYQELSGSDELTMKKDDPLSASVRHNNCTTLWREQWKAEVNTSSVMTVDEAHYYVETTVHIKENDITVHSVYNKYQYKR